MTNYQPPSVEDVPDEGEKIPTHFFDLPAEMRNRIYHFALVNQGETLITDQNWKQPNLLLASRQLRQEASQVFYFENTFRFMCPDFDCSALFNFGQHYCYYWGHHRAGKFKYALGHTRNNWANLERWMGYVHQRKLPALNRVNSDPPMDGRSLGAAAMKVARELRDMPWVRVKAVLEHVKDSNSHWV